MGQGPSEVFGSLFYKAAGTKKAHPEGEPFC